MNKRYIVEVQETTGTLDGKPRIAGTRLGLDILAFNGLTKFKKMYPVKNQDDWWAKSLKLLKQL